MKPVTVVVAVPDPITCESLTNSLRAHFRVVLPLAEFSETRATVLKHRADAVVLDLESTPIDEMSGLLREFPALSLVCIHRLADDVLWSSALSAGALDCCHPSDVRSIVMAVGREGRIAQGHAA